MRQSIEKTWKLLQVTVDNLKQNIPYIKVQENAFEIYDCGYRELYKNIQQKYMKKPEQNLDRHKEAAIIIISLIKANAVTCEKKIEEDERFTGLYSIAASVGFTFMINRLNKLLSEKNQPTISKLWYPDAISCDTDYFKIFYRNLYYADTNKEWGLNPLDIAERLFLLEYITMEKNGIDPHILKEDVLCR